MHWVNLKDWTGKKLWLSDTGMICCVREAVEVGKDSKVKGLDGQDKKTVKWYADIILLNGLTFSKEMKDEAEGEAKLKETLDFNC